MARFARDQSDSDFYFVIRDILVKVFFISYDNEEKNMEILETREKKKWKRHKMGCDWNNLDSI